MDQEAPAQAIELDDIAQDSASPLASDQPSNNVELDATQTGSNHVAGSNQPMAATSAVRDETSIRELLKHCSSQRMGVVFGLLALVVAIYSYYGQYQLSWKSWELGLWKDCRDRGGIASSNTCQRYQNVTYDQIVARNLELSTTRTLPPSHRESVSLNLVRELPVSDMLLVVRIVGCIFDCFMLTGWLCVIGAGRTIILVLIGDTTSSHAFPYRACFAVYVLINTSFATVMCSHWAMKTICGFLSILNVIRHFRLIRSALRDCVQARYKPSTKVNWRRQPILFLTHRYVRPVCMGSLMFSGHGIVTLLQPRGLSRGSDGLFTASYVLLFSFFALLSITRSLILHTENRLSMDFEAQSSTISEVSHKDMLSSRMEVIPGQLRKRWASSSTSEEVRWDIAK